jgi:hypothetical protein
MKTKLIILFLLIVSFSCRTNNKPVSDAQKDKIKGEVKEVVNTIFKGAQEANFDMAVESWLDSPDFVYMSNGNTFNYEAFVEAMKPMIGSFLNQKCTIVDEKFAVLDNSNVVYSANTKWLVNYKDGHSVLQDPWAMLFLFKKVDNRWRVISCTETGAEKIVKASDTPKELNQAELMKQNIGTWKCEIAKDTIVTWVSESYGTGLAGNIKYVTKGKTIKEGKGLYGYDKNIDKFIVAGLTKGEDIGIYALWFISNSKYELVPYGDLSNPSNASFKVEGEFKSPNMIVETTIMNNKSAKTDTWTRVK